MMEKIEISYRTIIFTIFFLVAVWVLYLIRGVIILWFIAFILMTALNPMVSFLERLKIPRVLSIALTFVFIIGMLALVIAGIVPPLIEQTTFLANSLSEKLPLPSVFQFNEGAIASQLEAISSSALNLVKIVIGAFSNILAVFSLIVFTFYLLIERKNLKHYLKLIFSDDDSEKRAEVLIDDIENKLGGWVRGEFFLMAIVGVMSYVGLTLLGIPYALPLALLAGLLELVPNIGPIVSAIPAIIIGFTVSQVLGGGVAILYLAVQQLENHIIVPMVMRQSVGIKPLITLMCLMVGGSLAGIAGAILAVPIFITTEIVLRNIYKYKQAHKS